MAKKNLPRHMHIFNLLARFTGVVVSLAVGFGLINGTLILPPWLWGTTYVGFMITQFVGWVVVVSTLVSVVLAILNK